MRMNKSRKIRETGRVAHILVGKPEGSRSLARPNCRWENDIKIDLIEIECEVVKWTQLVRTESSGGILQMW